MLHDSHCSRFTVHNPKFTNHYLTYINNLTSLWRSLPIQSLSPAGTFLCVFQTDLRSQACNSEKWSFSRSSFLRGVSCHPLTLDMYTGQKLVIKRAILGFEQDKMGYDWLSPLAVSFVSLDWTKELDEGARRVSRQSETNVDCRAKGELKLSYAMAHVCMSCLLQWMPTTSPVSYLGLAKDTSAVSRKSFQESNAISYRLTLTVPVVGEISRIPTPVALCNFALASHWLCYKVSSLVTQVEQSWPSLLVFVRGPRIFFIHLLCV